MGNSKQHEILIRYIDNSLEKISKTFAAHYKSNYNLTTRQMSTLWYLKYSGQMTMSEYANKENADGAVSKPHSLFKT